MTPSSHSVKPVYLPSPCYYNIIYRKFNNAEHFDKVVTTEWLPQNTLFNQLLRTNLLFSRPNPDTLCIQLKWPSADELLLWSQSAFHFSFVPKIIFLSSTAAYNLNKTLFCIASFISNLFRNLIKIKMRNKHRYFTKTQSDHNCKCIWSLWDMAKQRYKVGSYHICTFEMWPLNLKKRWGVTIWEIQKLFFASYLLYFFLVFIGSSYGHRNPLLCVFRLFSMIENYLPWNSVRSSTI